MGLRSKAGTERRRTRQTIAGITHDAQFGPLVPLTPLVLFGLSDLLILLRLGDLVNQFGQLAQWYQLTPIQ